MNFENISPDSIENAKEEISFSEIGNKITEFINYIKLKWFIFLISGIIGICLAFAYFLYQRPTYDAECTFILEEKSGGIGGLAGIASQFGFDPSGGGGGSSLFAGDNLLEIIPSRNIVEKVLLSRVDSTTENTLADLFLEFTNRKNAWSNNERLSKINFSKANSTAKLSMLQDSVLNVVYKQFIKNHLKVDWARKKASLIKVSVTSKSEKFSKYSAERLVYESRKYYVELKTGRSQSNVDRLQLKADSLLELLNNKSYQNAHLQILNPNPAIKEALVPTEITSRDKTVIGTIYAEVVKNLEASKILLSQQTPIIQILDSSDFPLESNKMTFLVIFILALSLTEFIVFLIFFIKFLVKSN
jgi:hypothetical protein